MQKVITFEDLPNADLIVDALYKGGTSGNAGDDPISKMLPCGNQRGFRYRGNVSAFKLNFIVLYSSLADIDWPDSLDGQTGRFTYYGDNKEPGRQLHDTVGRGNLILRDCFNALHSGYREAIPPFFIFTKGAIGRDVTFRGIAVPGAAGLSPAEDLVAIWKSKHGYRFQNYKAIFTVLDVATISRNWINDILDFNTITSNAPNEWAEWVEKGLYKPLVAQRTAEYRSKEEQVPHDAIGIDIINKIYRYFEDGYAFEACAAEIVKLMDQNIISCDLTRPWGDGGRDATGVYRVGLDSNAITVDFALEAKRYGLDASVNVKSTSRLIARLRHRQFGILVTTSYVGRQAYKEIKEDGHPVIIISAIDIVNILKNAGYNNMESVAKWLSNFPKCLKLKS